MDFNKLYWIVKFISITIVTLLVLIIAVNYLVQGYVKEAALAAFADLIIFWIAWWAYKPLLKRK